LFRKIFLIPLVLVLLLAAGGFGYTYWNQKNIASAASSAEESVKTAQVRVGNLTLSAAGTGTLVAGRQADLSFPVAGKVAKVNVRVGELVEEGQVLASLSNISTLEASLTSAELTLKLAEQALQDLRTNAQSNLANAKLTLATAVEAYNDAKESIKQEGWTRCDEETILAYEDSYNRLNDHYKQIKDVHGDTEYYLNVVLPAKTEKDRAYATWQYCLRYTEYEIQTSQAEAVVAEAVMNQAQAEVDLLEANAGIDPTTLAQAKNDVANAQIANDTAKQNLDGAVLKAPFSGTVLSVAGSAGDQVGTDAFISIIDLAHPNVDFAVDETDMDKVFVGADAQVVFDALPDLTFTGKVVQVSPSLENSNGYTVLTGVVELDLSDQDSSQSIIEGLNASVEIISASAQNAILVPVEALRDLGDDQYAVFVVGSDGSLKMKVVTVGIKDATYAEITDGLSQGDVVSTGIAETN